MSLMDADRQWFKSTFRFNRREIRRDVSFCNNTLLQSGVYIIDDVTKDDQFASNPMITEDRLVFYAGVPFFSHDGFAIGTLCVMDRKSRVLTSEQQQALLSLSRQVRDQLELRRKSIESQAIRDEKKKLSQELDTSLAYFRSILDTWRDGVLIEDEEKICYMNAAYARLYGARNADELLGKHLSNLAAPEDPGRSRFLARYRRVCRGSLCGGFQSFARIAYAAFIRT